MSAATSDEIDAMSTNVVNLDAILPREDMAVQDTSNAKTLNAITIPHLTGFVFGPDLRKPQFQRETNQWSPAKVVDLLTAFLDLDLIPAVILWRAGKYIFVVDGAHRLSAVLAWIYDDYGDGTRSQGYFGPMISDDQKRLADKTRKLVAKHVGSYATYESAKKSGAPLDGTFAERMNRLSEAYLMAQWVPTNDPDSAEASFFKINQAATPIDPTERRILKARKSASAIAARAVTNAGTGHKYWSKFGNVIQAEIEDAGRQIYNALYTPPIGPTPITTLDVPVAGRGYNALPFVFDLVNDSNNVLVSDTTKSKVTHETLEEDADGSKTLNYLKQVLKKVELITTDKPQSLGLHPVVYFYSRGGSFRAESFLAACRFVEQLKAANQLYEFQNARKDFESYLIDHREAPSLIVNRLGTGSRSIPRIIDYYFLILGKFLKGMDANQAFQSLKGDAEFEFLTTPPPAPKVPKAGGAFSSQTKTAAFFDQALPGGTRCGICGAHVHKNSMHIDHKVKKNDGGHSGLTNAQVTHPWCDSTKG